MACFASHHFLKKLNISDRTGNFSFSTSRVSKVFEFHRMNIFAVSKKNQDPFKNKY